MSENEKLRQALEEHKRNHPETEEETLVALGRVLYPKEEQQRGSHAIREEERLKREAHEAELAEARRTIAHLGDNGVTNINADTPILSPTQEPYQSREQLANRRITNATGILSVIRERRKIGFSDIFAEKESKK